MKLFNKFELIGIFLSIGAMALVLATVRFNPEKFALSEKIDSDTQGAVVSVTQNKEKGDAELETALKDASTSKGELVKLVTDDVRIGLGAEVKDGDTVTVHYIGTTQNGVRFDSSYERGEPFTFTVGGGMVIQGWEKGLIGMKVGGQRILVIPAEMAYGNRQVGSIPANSPLVFAVELLSVK
jgi:FKBP-type peptidyl-prolyl cis-trans isomerase